MEKYVYLCKIGHGEKFNFILDIGDDRTRFGDEGILQNVELWNDTSLLYETTFGRKQAMNFFNMNFFKNLDNDIKNTYFTYWNEEEFERLESWLITSLTPKTEQRKVKIDRIKNKINATL